MSCAVNGLPQRTFCFKTFTTWRQFQNHLDRQCCQVRPCDTGLDLDALLREEEEQRILRMHQSLVANLLNKPYGEPVDGTGPPWLTNAVHARTLPINVVYVIFTSHGRRNCTVICVCITQSGFHILSPKAPSYARALQATHHAGIATRVSNRRTPVQFSLSWACC